MSLPACPETPTQTLDALLVQARNLALSIGREYQAELIEWVRTYQPAPPGFMTDWRP